MNLIPKDYSGTKQIGQMWGNLIAQIPQMIREDKKFQIEMQKIGDVEKINETAFTQLKAISSELGLDPSVVQKPITGQDPQEYITKGVQSFMMAAKSKNVEPQLVMDSISKLSGGGTVEGVQEEQAHVSRKGASQESLMGIDPDTTQMGGGVPGESQWEGKEGYGKNIMEPLLDRPSPYELPEGTEGSVSQQLDQIAEEKSTGLGHIPVMDDPELMEQLQLLPRSKRREVYNKLQDPDAKYYEADALTEVTKYVQAQTKLKETKEKAGLEHKRTIETEITGPSKARTKEQYLETVFSGQNVIYDPEGNIVESVDPRLALKGHYRIGEKKPSVSKHIGTYRGGGGGEKPVTSYDDLLKRRKELLAEKNDLSTKLKLDPKSLAAEGGSKESVQRDINDHKIMIKEISVDIETARKREDYTGKPIEAPDLLDKIPLENKNDRDAYKWAIANSTDPRASQILSKLKTKYGF